MQMINTIFFDVGHTLIRPAQSTTTVCHELLSAHGFAIARERVKAAMHTADLDHLTRYHTPNHDWADPETIYALWLRYYRHVFELLALPELTALRADALAHELITWYGRPAAWQPFPEALETLAELHAAGYRLGAVSDWSVTLTPILHTLGLSRHLDFALGSGNIGFCKPHIDFYRLALKRAGAEPHEALHVGDSYYADVRGARAAGITPVLIDRSRKLPPLDCITIHDLRDLASVITDR
jgi:putative hydrolase of the HAD superfamily